MNKREYFASPVYDEIKPEWLEKLDFRISKKITKIEAPLPSHMGLVWKYFGWKI